MNLGTHPFRAALAVAAAGCLIAGVAQPATAAPPDSVPAGVPQLEALDRGLVAVATSEGVFLSWRLLAYEVDRRTPTPAWPAPTSRVYRDGAADRDGHRQHQLPRCRRHRRPREYRVAPVVRRRRGRRQRAGRRRGRSGYYDLPLQQARRRRHARAGEAYTYSANDVERRRRRRRRQLRVRRQVGPVELQGRLPARLHRARLHRHLRARRHPAVPPRPRREHPRRRALHAVPGLRLRRRRPLGDDAEDRARHEDRSRYDADGTVASERYITMPERGRRGPATRTPTTTAERRRLLRAPGRDVPGLAPSTPRWWPGTGRRRWSRRSASRRTHDYPLSDADADGARRLLHRRLRARAAAPATSCASSRASSSTAPST